MAQPSIAADLDAWRRVARRILDRRLELDLGQDQLGVSKSVASNLENARQTSYARASLARVARALGWAPSSIEDILDGGEPAPVGGDTADGGDEVIDLRQLAVRIEQLTEEVASLRHAIEHDVVPLAAAGGDARGPARGESSRPHPGEAPLEQDDA